MYQSTRKLSELKKAQILEASYEPECVISELAKQHGISARVIYGWRNKKKTESESESVITAPERPALDFVELSVCPPAKKEVSLKRAVLEFNNLSISIDGNIKSSTLVQMLNILEESC